MREIEIATLSSNLELGAEYNTLPDADLLNNQRNGLSMIGHYEYCIHAALSVSNDSKIGRLVVTKVSNVISRRGCCF
jgi:hypothetical protein